jgi:site-specific recombinase XerD
MLHKFLQDFLEYLEIEKGRSKKTIENYHHYIGRFFVWLASYFQKSEEGLRPGDITLDSVRKFRLFLNNLQGKESGTLKRNTQNYHLIALRTFLAYLIKRDIPILAPDKIELAKHPPREISFLSAEEVDRLLKSPSGSHIRVLRDRAILNTLFSSGVRVSELCSLNREQIDWQKGEITVRGKGDKFRVVFLSDAAKSNIQEYLTKRVDIDPSLFIRIPRDNKFERYQNLRLTPRSIQRTIRYYASKAGIVKKVTPHAMRHSFATDLLRAGADIRSVQAMLGHSSITTTQIYTHVTDKELRQVHERFHHKAGGEKKETEERS